MCHEGMTFVVGEGCRMERRGVPKILCWRVQIMQQMLEGICRK